MLSSKTSFEELLRPSKQADRAPLTKIICTVGPSSESPEVLTDLVKSGVQGFRIDLKWADAEWAKIVLKTIAQVEATTGVHVAVILDTSGPELRVRNTAKACLAKASPSAPPQADIEFQAGSSVTLTLSREKPLSASVVPIDCSQPFTTLGLLPGARLFISSYLSSGGEVNSTLAVEVKRVAADEAECEVLDSCALPRDKKLTLHGSNIHRNRPILSSSDAHLLRVLCSLGGIHFVDVSYCRSALDIHQVQTFLKEIGMEHVKVLAKICTMEGVGQCKDIVAAADGVVLGRGTLGLELPPEKVFLAQKTCVHTANLLGKLAVVTRVVDTMVHAPRPTRAEATDVANLVLDGADCILLGAETFRGDHPLASARTVLDICRQAEAVYDSTAFYTHLMDENATRGSSMNKTEALASSAVRASTKLDATMVLAFTKTGRTARFLAKYRSAVPILTVVAEGAPGAPPVGAVARQCSLLRGVTALVVPKATAGDLAVSTGGSLTDGSLTEWALQKGQEMNMVRDGDRVVVSQCPRLLPDSYFAEAGAVKFVVAGASTPTHVPKVGSCMEMDMMMSCSPRVSTPGPCTPDRKTSSSSPV